MPTSFRLMKHMLWTSAAAFSVLAVVGAFGPDFAVTESVAAADGWGVGSKPEFVGNSLCYQCHNESVDDSSEFEPLNREFSSLEEASIFYSADKHQDAFNLLKCELGLAMQKILAPSREEGYEVIKDKKCLACHSNHLWKVDPEPPRHFESGVTCESCHGAGSLWKGWHDSPRWRTMSAAEKEEKYGMIDVRNPVRRAQQCFACHIGSVEQGKVVTHEMYAAGHPPLPGIEIESFSEQMPVHWRSLREKGKFRFYDEYRKANYPGLKHDPREDLARTKSVIIGGTMALRESVNLFASQAAEPDDAAWPELAVFDCSACHHDLSAPSWRQKRGYGRSLPGRPQMFAWPEALVKLGIRHRAGDNDDAFKQDWDAYQGKAEALRRAVGSRPFGDPEAIKAVAFGEDGLIAWLDQLSNDVFRSSVDRQDARRALQTLVTQSPETYPDFHSARQLMWAIRTILSEVNTTIPEFAAEPDGETEKQSIQRALANLQIYNSWKAGDRAAAQKKASDLLSQLELIEKLRLDLPSGNKYVIAEQLPESLKAIGGYDPEWFREQLQDLAKSIGAQSN